MTVLARRTMLGGLLSLAAPAIIRTPGLLMPIKPPKVWQSTEEAYNWIVQQTNHDLKALLAVNSGEPLYYNEEGWFRILEVCAGAASVPVKMLTASDVSLMWMRS